MLVHLHIGLDKAGSTAIQYQMFLNRQWYAQRGVFIPDTGLGWAGHQVLFKEMFPDDLAQLERELKLARSIGFEQFYISWEGMHSMPPDSLETLKKLFPGSDFKIYVYLREQSETVQSGYLQQVKTGSNRLTLTEAKASKAYLTQKMRDYQGMLDKFAKLFGKDAIEARVYDRKLLLEGDVVKDMLATQGLEPDHEFIFGHQESNISLDAASALLMNEIDRSRNLAWPERVGIVDFLLNDISINGTQEKYFLSEQEVALIKSHYLSSNRAAVKTYLPSDWPYPDLFPYNKKTHTDATEAEMEAAVAAKRKKLDQVESYWSWGGKELNGSDLSLVAARERGWHAADESGVCPVGKTAEIRCRVLWKHIRGSHDGIRLALRSSFSAEGPKPRVSINNAISGELKPGVTAFIVPFEAMNTYHCINIRIDYPSASAQGRPPDNTFTLQAVRFVMNKKESEEAMDS